MFILEKNCEILFIKKKKECDNWNYYIVGICDDFVRLWGI